MLTCIIPARGGSQRLPGKNLRVVGGQTLLTRCIRTCKAVTSDVLVTTDDDAIAEEAELALARVHRRPAELAGSNTSVEDTVWEALQATNGSIIACVQCTNPFLTSGDIWNAIDQLQTSDVGIVVNRFNGFLVDPHGAPINWIPGKGRQTDQYTIAGSCWAFYREHITSGRSLYDGTLGLVEAEARLHLDIDTEDDLHHAELIFRGLTRREKVGRRR